MKNLRTVNVLVNRDDILYAVTNKDIAKKKAKYIKNTILEYNPETGEDYTKKEAFEKFGNDFVQTEISWEAYKLFLENTNNELFHELTGYYFS